MRVLGLDLSLTGTGVAKPDGSTLVIKTGSLRGCERLIRIRNEVMAIVIADMPTLVIIEDRVNHIGDPGATAELHGVIKVALHEWNVPFALVSAPSLKQYGCGKGNGKKEDMKLHAYMRYGREFKSNDECDAYLLRAMGLEYLGSPLSVAKNLTKQEDEAVRKSMLKVDWPAVSDAA